MAEKLVLQKFLAKAALASRREGERLIESGRVSINGRTVLTPGVLVDPENDEVRLDGQPVGLESAHLYVLLYKPAKYMTTRDDPEGRPTVYELLKGLPPHLAYVGRLDWDAEGALLFTNDGAFVNRMTHPTFHIPKTYRVKVQKLPSNDALEQLRNGVRLDDGRTQPCEVEVLYLTEGGNVWLEIVLSEGRKNQIKRMIKAVGHRVMRILRTHIGPVFIGEIEPGQWRHLSDQEVEQLKALVDQPYEGSARSNPVRKPRAARRDDVAPTPMKTARDRRPPREGRSPKGKETGDAGRPAGRPSRPPGRDPEKPAGGPKGRPAKAPSRRPGSGPAKKPASPRPGKRWRDG